MCLILLAWQAHIDFPLIVAANRDELHARPTAAAHIWPDTDPLLLAGKDLQAGGSWMGITRNARFAAVTNYRENPAVRSELSRGQLITDFLTGRQSARQYAQRIHADGERYAGFNLLVGDIHQLLHVSNRSDSVTAIKPGVHGLSNATLNTPWPKVKTGKSQLRQILDGPPDHQQLQNLLSNQQIADDELLPSTGVSIEVERLLSARKIVMPDYGTRSSTTVLLSADGQIDFHEQRYAADGRPDGDSLITL